jgi:hypothetical protein
MLMLAIMPIGPCLLTPYPLTILRDSSNFLLLPLPLRPYQILGTMSSLLLLRIENTPSIHENHSSVNDAPTSFFCRFILGRQKIHNIEFRITRMNSLLASKNPRDKEVSIVFFWGVGLIPKISHLRRTPV